ncbi:MAG: Unknown protein [uncultured Sulfurovum sp.]|uniref:Integral membrane protein n=1 Tax=uncultured Sulfurovum sp. TaxID=269237 RepID=A0A6S6T9S6_9BACT|nr:MAG: Unknown protein [uncultured Sulfurovum sp.]
MVKTFFSFLFTLIVLISIYLSIFELLLYSFHSPFGVAIKNPIIHEQTWTYLLHQQYISLIEIDNYTIYEKRHLLDVKKLLEQTYNLWLFFIILSSIILIKFFHQIIQNLIFIGIIFNLLLIVLSLNFIKIFDLLHSLLFTNNSWVFSSDSLLIESFPLLYFQHFFALFLIITFLIFFLVQKILLKYSTVFQG